MLGSKKKLLYCLILILLSGVSQGAFAWRFGLNTGLYNESIMTGAFRSREIGLRLGFYADRTFNDILYASAMRGNGGLGGGIGGGQGLASPCFNNACGGEAFMPPPQTPCGQQIAYMPSPPPPVSCCGQPSYSPPPVGCSSSYASMAPVGCSSDMSYAAPSNNTQAAGKTEIYLVVLPSQYSQPQPQQQQMPYYPQQQAQAPSYQQSYPQMPPQGYYRDSNVDYRQPVRGMW